MAKGKNLVGQKIGHWTVLRKVENDSRGNSQWLCRCECGKEKVVRGQRLRNGESTSCGCKRKKFTETYGSKSRLYRIWRGMLTRCENPNNHAFEHYGAKGISVCEEWHSFGSFRDWSFSNGYSEKSSIDRICNDGGYNPENCRWVENWNVQMNNRSSCHVLEFKGEKKTISEWANITGLKSTTIRKRLDMGWNIEAALKTPARKREQ